MRLGPLRLGGDGVVVLWDEVVHVADGLEEDVEAVVALDLPEHTTVLEPRVREDAVQAAEDVGEVAHAGLGPAAGLGAQRQPAGEVLGRGEDVGGPVECVAAVVDGTARLGRVVYRAQVLPLRGAHLRARLRRAGRVLGEEGDDQVVHLHGQEAAELVEPEGALHPLGRFREIDGDFARDGHDGAGAVGLRIVVVEGLEVFLQLEWGVELVYIHVSATLEQPSLFTAERTCESGIRGGPEAISAALVPGRILRVEPSSVSCDSLSPARPYESPTVGDLGPIWTSVKGGGLGSRGELEGDTPAAAMAEDEEGLDDGAIGSGQVGGKSGTAESSRRTGRSRSRKSRASGSSSPRPIADKP